MELLDGTRKSSGEGKVCSKSGAVSTVRIDKFPQNGGRGEEGGAEGVLRS